MKSYHGADRRGAYFEGWYLKHQGAEGEFAVIPAFHRDRRGTESASIQVVTRGAGKLFTFPARSFQAWPDRFQVRVGANWFSQEGLHLELEEPGFSLRGDLRYGPFHPLTSDIMGPFRFAPGLPCVHGVLSMEHRVDGMVSLNGAPCFFSRGKGYAETDRGRSFPSQYLWTQCSWQERQRGSRHVVVALLYEVGHDVSLQMVDIDERYAQSPCEAFGEADTHEQRTHKSRSSCECHCRELFLGDTGFFQCLVNHGHHILLMGS